MGETGSRMIRFNFPEQLIHDSRTRSLAIAQPLACILYSRLFSPRSARQNANAENDDDGGGGGGGGGGGAQRESTGGR